MLAEKDDMLAKLLAKLLVQHSEDLRRKDEQLERLVQRLAAGEQASHTSHAAVERQPQIVSMPPAAPSVPHLAAPSPLQARRTQPDAARQDQSQPISISSSASVPTDDWVALLQTGGDEVEPLRVMIYHRRHATLDLGVHGRARIEVARDSSSRIIIGRLHIIG